MHRVRTTVLRELHVIPKNGISVGQRCQHKAREAKMPRDFPEAFTKNVPKRSEAMRNAQRQRILIHADFGSCSHTPHRPHIVSIRRN